MEPLNNDKQCNRAGAEFLLRVVRRAGSEKQAGVKEGF